MRHNWYLLIPSFSFGKIIVTYNVRRRITQWLASCFSSLYSTKRVNLLTISTLQRSDLQWNLPLWSTSEHDLLCQIHFLVLCLMTNFKTEISILSRTCKFIFTTYSSSAQHLKSQGLVQKILSCPIAQQKVIPPWSKDQSRVYCNTSCTYGNGLLKCLNFSIRRHHGLINQNSLGNFRPLFLWLQHIQRILTHFVRGGIIVQLTICLIFLDSGALLTLN